MRKTLLYLTLLLVALNAYSQAPSKPILTHDYYLKKSKKQKTIGWVLLGTGLLSTITGIVQKDSVNILFGGNVKNNDDVAFYILGASAMAVSVPFFLASAKNRQRAATATIGFTNQHVACLQQNGFALKSQPAITLKLRLTKFATTKINNGW